MRSHTKVPIAGLDWISAGMAIVLAVLFFGAAGESASAATGRPYLETIPTTGEGPAALTADAAGNLYLGNIVGGAGVVEKIDAAGNPIDFTASAPYISANRLMYGSGDIAVSKANGFIYLSRGEEAHGVRSLRRVPGGGSSRTVQLRSRRRSEQRRPLPERSARIRSSPATKWSARIRPTTSSPGG